MATKYLDSKGVEHLWNETTGFTVDGLQALLDNTTNTPAELAAANKAKNDATLTYSIENGSIFSSTYSVRNASAADYISATITPAHSATVTVPANSGVTLTKNANGKVEVKINKGANTSITMTSAGWSVPYSYEGLTVSKGAGKTNSRYSFTINKSTISNKNVNTGTKTAIINNVKYTAIDYASNYYVVALTSNKIANGITVEESGTSVTIKLKFADGTNVVATPWDGTTKNNIVATQSGNNYYYYLIQKSINGSVPNKKLVGSQFNTPTDLTNPLSSNAVGYTDTLVTSNSSYKWFVGLPSNALGYAATTSYSLK